MADLDDMVQDLDITPTDKESLDKDNKQASNFTLESIESAPNENSFDRCYGNFSLLGLKRGAKKEWFFQILSLKNYLMQELQQDLIMLAKLYQMVKKKTVQ